MKDGEYSRQWGNPDKCLEVGNIRVEHEGGTSERVFRGIVRSKAGYVGWRSVF